MREFWDKQQLVDLFPVCLHDLKFTLLETNHADFVYQLRSDENVMLFVDSPLIRNLEEALNYIKTVIENSTGFRCVVSRNGKNIGLIGLYNLNFYHCFGNISYELLPMYWQRGLGSLMVKTFVDYLLKHSLLNRIEAQTHINNIASIKTLEKSGFKLEGIMRGNFYFHGKYDNSFLFSRIKSDVLVDLR